MTEESRKYSYPISGEEIDRFHQIESMTKPHMIGTRKDDNEFKLILDNFMDLSGFNVTETRFSKQLGIFDQ